MPVSLPRTPVPVLPLNLNGVQLWPTVGIFLGLQLLHCRVRQFVFYQGCLLFLVVALQNLELVVQCGGVAAIMRNVLHNSHLARIKESLLSTILYLINHPRTRHYFKAGGDLEVGILPSFHSGLFIRQTTGHEANFVGLAVSSRGRFKPRFLPSGRSSFFESIILIWYAFWLRSMLMARVTSGSCGTWTCHNQFSLRTVSSSDFWTCQFIKP